VSLQTVNRFQSFLGPKQSPRTEVDTWLKRGCLLALYSGVNAYRKGGTSARTGILCLESTNTTTAVVSKRPATTSKKQTSNRTTFPNWESKFVEGSVTLFYQSMVTAVNYVAWQIHKSIRTNAGVPETTATDLSVDSLRHYKKLFDVTELEQNAPGVRRNR
jgi:hypothetical protein